MTEGNWLECCVDADYEIFSEYPYPIRRKGTDKIIKECVNKDGYVCCRLNNKIYYKHRIIAEQFIPNPENKTEIDHINHDRADNRIENLRWVSRSENQKNKTGCVRKYVYHDALPESAESLDSYSKHELDGVYVDFENKKLYLWVCENKYRELLPTRCNGCIIYWVRDVENKKTALYHKVLFG
jgi:hypothetical protein